MLWLWIGFGLLIIALLALDLGVFHRHSHAIKLREASGWTVFWIAIGSSFAVPLYFIYESHWLGAGAAARLGPGELATNGTQAVALYITGYLLEKSLSMDNIFVIAVVFRSFGVQPVYQHRVLYWGILGAIVFRAIMIFGGVWLLARFEWLFYVFGAYLVIAGLRMIRPREQAEEREVHWLVAHLQRWFPVTSEGQPGHFLARVNGRLHVTVLFLTLVVVEVTDVIFAVDSVPAVLAISTDPFIVLTSNIFAILGLRSLYFVLSSVIDKFPYLHYSLAAILVVVGAKMMLRDLVHVPTVASLVTIVALMAAGIGASLWKDRKRVSAI